MNGWGRKEEPSLKVRILLQVLRFALAALFFYIAYLGFVWRSTSPPPAPPVSTERQQPSIKPPGPAPQAPGEAGAR